VCGLYSIVLSLSKCVHDYIFFPSQPSSLGEWYLASNGLAHIAHKIAGL
jgi:hypothetical protein